jgi:predicted metal-binding protein
MRQIVKPVLNNNVRELCSRPYTNHPCGCPNYGKRESCPPRVKIFEQVFDINQPIYAIWTIFSFGQHLEKMRALHPDWSERQLACCLYWQGTARKNLKAEIVRFKMEHPELVVTTCPEAMGIDVTATMQTIGEHLEWPPKIITYQVALAAKLKEVKK